MVTPNYDSHIILLPRSALEPDSADGLRTTPRGLDPAQNKGKYVDVLPAFYFSTK